jgi:uncharacterized protein YbjQ (UPF0145 family)
MPFAENVFVSTTSSVDHADIVEYHGVIATYVVAGTGLFSDVAASFSDVFGGRSKSYQKQLAKINAEAVRQLKSKAASEGANGIVGLRVDHDQVSSQGKAMFMVTVTGTAVTLNTRETSAQETGGSSSNGRVSGSELDVELRKRTILEKLDSEEDSTLEKEMVAFLRDHQVVEAAPHLLDRVGTKLKRYRDTKGKEPFSKRVEAYFLNLPREAARDHLYGAIMNGDKYLVNFALRVIDERDLFDADRVKQLIEEGGLVQRKAGLWLTKVDKRQYTQDDLQALEKLLEVVRSDFPEVAETVREKHTFSTRKTLKWECVCGTRNDRGADRCEDCHRDRNGFKPNDWSQEEAADLLERKVEVLRERFGPGRPDKPGW